MSYSSDVRLRSGKEPPVVICPGCNIEMIPTDKKALAGMDLVDITYRCGKCGTQTSRAIKDD